MKFLPFLIFYFTINYVFAQVSGDYRSVQSGNWNLTSTWERFNGTIWEAATTTPTSSTANVITIQTGHTVTIPASFAITVDQIVISGALQINTGGTFTLDYNSASSSDLIVSGGSINVSGVFELLKAARTSGTTTTNTSFLSASRYRHLYLGNQGSVPIANWDINSTVEIAGFSLYNISFTAAGNWSQSFGNVEFNCNLSSGIAIDFNGLINDVRGNFSSLNTGAAGVLRLSLNQISTINVDGNFDILNNSFVVVNSAGTTTLNINGNFTVDTGNSLNSRLTNAGSTTVNLAGSLILLRGRLETGLSGTGNSIINIFGDFLSTGGILTESGASTFGQVRFVRDSSLDGINQIFSGTGSIQNTIHFFVGPSSIVNMGTNVLTSTGDLTLSGILKVGTVHISGSIQLGTSGGNLRNAGTRTYNSGSKIVYSGTGAQYVGNGHPNLTDVDVQFDNPTSVTLLNSIITRDLTITQGDFSGNGHNITLTRNWIVTGGTFFPGAGTVIFDGASQINLSAPKQFRHITVNSSKSLTLPSGQVNISGDVNFAAGSTVNHNSGLVLFNSSLSQSISANGATFNNLTVNKTSGTVTLASALNLIGRLDIQSATTFASAGNLTLISTSVGTTGNASIGPLLGSATVSGNINIQRFMNAVDDVDRFISSPLSSAPVSQLQDDFFITGSFTGTSFPCTGCKNNGASLRYYDEAVSGALKAGYKQYPLSANTESLVPGVGYDAWMWNGISPIVVDLTGTINKGTINYNISHTPSTPTPDVNADGWNLIGNPYPSSIAWNNGTGWTKNQIAPIVYVWDVSAKVYRTYNANTSVGDLTGGVIATGQAFWVYANQPGASMSINENAKTTLTGAFRREKIIDQKGLSVSLTTEGSTDNSFILLTPDASQDFEPGLDALKFQDVEELAIGFVDSKNRILVNYVTNSLEKEAIPLYIKGTKEGKYQISFETLGNFDLYNEFYLVDTYLKISSKISSPYIFSWNPNNIKMENRFILTMNPETSLQESGEKLIAVYPNPVSNSLYIEINSPNVSSVELMDNIGRSHENVLMQEINGSSKGRIDMTNKPAGMYFINAKVNGRIYIEKIVKQ